MWPAQANLFLLVAAVMPAASSAAMPRSPNRSPHTLEYLLSLTDTPGGRPAGVSAEYDCSWRELAVPYALKIQPSLSQAQQKQLHDALQLSTLCAKPFVPVATPPAPPVAQLLASTAMGGRPELFVDASKGSDSNTGTQALPFRTIEKALEASRMLKHGIADAPVISLRAGTFFLNQTLRLSAADSGLTIAAYQHETAVISGGVPLTELKWTKSAANPKIWVTPIKELVGGREGGFISSSGALPAGNDIRKANMTAAGAIVWCQANATCAGFTLRVGAAAAAAAGGAPSSAVREIYFKSVARDLIADAGWVTYRKPRAGSGPPLPAMSALQFPPSYRSPAASDDDHGGINGVNGSGDGGGVWSRATLARYPNANPELDLFPLGYITAKNSQAWLPPKGPDGEVCNPHYQCGKSVNLTFPAPKSEWHGMYQDYTVGVGGSCEVYDPPWSPWCSGQFYLERQFPEMHTRHPSGITTAALPNAPYAKPAGATVHAWRPGHWYTWMFQVQSYNASSSSSSSSSNGGGGSSEDSASTDVDGSSSLIGGGGSYIFSTDKGGNQGGEGSESAGEWWIEGMKEDLDAPNEYWYDEEAKELYFYYNGTGTPPTEAVVPTLANLIELQGAQSYPVRNVSLLGLTFTANRPTFMEQRGNPSGGDWSLERMGAVMLEGVEDILIARCTFTKLDSNALFLSGYSRRAIIANNSFTWLGQNGIASWGRPLYNDGTNGDQPRGTVVSGNWATEVGIIQKQSSMYFQAETAQATIVDNIVFNIPRAAVNFNDGFGGGAEMAYNLLFNTCRESSDHGKRVLTVCILFVSIFNRVC